MANAGRDKPRYVPYVKLTVKARESGMPEGAGDLWMTQGGRGLASYSCVRWASKPPMSTMSPEVAQITAHATGFGTFTRPSIFPKPYIQKADGHAPHIGDVFEGIIRNTDYTARDVYTY